MKKVIISSILFLFSTGTLFAEERCYIKNMENIEKIFVVSLDNSSSEKTFDKFALEFNEELTYALFLTNKKPVLWNIKNYNRNLGAVVALGEGFSDYVVFNKQLNQEQAYSLGRGENCLVEKYKFYKNVNKELDNKVKFMTGKDKYYFIGLDINNVENNVVNISELIN